MKISSKSWKSYIDTLSKIDKKAAETVSNYYREHPDLSIEQLIGYCVAVADYYGNAAGELACEMYEEVAAASGKIVPPAEPAPTATYKEMAGAVRGTLLRSQNPDAVGAVVGRKVKTVGLDTILKNSLRDGAQFAWIPSGDTCAFCMMLASNGWQRASKKALKNGHASHVHNNCDCSYAVRFDDNTEVEGYDPDYYKEIYDNADGDNWNEKLNFMRRTNYAENKDSINEQKRIAYAKRKELAKTEESGIINTKITDKGEVINPMSSNEYFAIREKLEKQGIKIYSATGGDDLRYMMARGAEGTYGDGIIRHIGEIPSRGTLFEEIIHMSQARKYGELELNDYIELYAREIEANRKLLKYKDAYRLDTFDIKDIENNLSLWESKFKLATGKSFDESNYRKKI